MLLLIKFVHAVNVLLYGICRIHKYVSREDYVACKYRRVGWRAYCTYIKTLILTLFYQFCRKKFKKVMYIFKHFRPYSEGSLKPSGPCLKCVKIQYGFSTKGCRVEINIDESKDKAKLQIVSISFADINTHKLIRIHLFYIPTYSMFYIMFEQTLHPIYSTGHY